MGRKGTCEELRGRRNTLKWENEAGKREKGDTESQRSRDTQSTDTADTGRITDRGVLVVVDVRGGFCLAEPQCGAPNDFQFTSLD